MRAAITSAGRVETCSAYAKAVQGPPVVHNAYPMNFQQLTIGLGQFLVPGNTLGMGGGLVAIAIFERGGLDNGPLAKQKEAEGEKAHFQW